VPDDNYRPRVKIKKASAGLGLFANEDIPRGQTIIEYMGERITSNEADRRGGLYLFDVKRDLVIDGKERGNIARYINHACKPNAVAEHDVDEDRIYITARKKIEAGEEIVYNYGKQYFEDMLKEKDCLCSTCLS
jgi:uncharacterized protein